MFTGKHGPGPITCIGVITAALAGAIGLGLSAAAATAATTATTASHASLAGPVTVTLPDSPNIMDRGVVVDPGTDTAWVAVDTAPQATVYGIDLANATVTATVTLPTPVVSAVAVDPVDHIVFAGSPSVSLGGGKSTANSVYVADEATGKITGTVALAAGESPAALGYDPATSQLFAALDKGGRIAVAVIDPVTTDVLTTVPVPQLSAVTDLAADTAGGTVYVAGTPQSAGRADIVAIGATANAATDAVTTTIATPSTPDASVTVNGSALYALIYGGVIRYDAASGTQEGRVSFPATISAGLAVNTVTGNLYANDFAVATGNLAQVNDAATAITGQGPFPGIHLAVDSATGTVVSTGQTGSGTASKVLVHIIPLSATTAITSPGAVTLIAGRGSFTVTANGELGAVVTEAGILPTGVGLTPSGVLSGASWAAPGGVYKITLTAGNGLGAPVTQAFTLTLELPAAIVTVGHDSFPHGKHDIMPVRATGWPTPTITEAGKLPPGVKFTAGKNGTAIVGTPAASAKGRTYIIYLTATNKAGSASQKFTLKVT
jgi:DNA-binding beta-propeller fold protein YncE